MNNTRRRLLTTGATVLLGGFAGCTELLRSQTEPPTHTTAREPETKATAGTSETTGRTDSHPTADSETPGTPTDTRESPPNQTVQDTKTTSDTQELSPEQTVQQTTARISESGALRRSRSSSFTQATRETVVVRDSDWRDQIHPEPLDDETVKILEQTDYDSAYVVGFEGGLEHGQSYALKEVKRSSNELRLRCARLSGVGPQILVYRLLLLRLSRASGPPPNIVTVEIGELTQTPP